MQLCHMHMHPGFAEQMCKRCAADHPAPPPQMFSCPGSGSAATRELDPAGASNTGACDSAMLGRELPAATGGSGTGYLTSPKPTCVHDDRH
jgi:hypothetical protein